MANIKVKFSYINEKGVYRTVSVLIDEGLNKDLEKVSEEERINYLREEYLWQCKEQMHRRKSASLQKFYPDGNDLELADTYQTERKDTYDQVEEILSSINSDYDRELIVMYYLDGMTQEDIAKKLGITKGTVSKQLAKIIAEIKNNFNVE